MRVNARFEGVAEQQVEYLAATTGQKVSDVLRQSVDFYYRHVRSEGGQLKHLSRLIGKGDSGQSDISANVKKYLAQGLDDKYATDKPATGPRRAAAKSTKARPKPAA